MLGFGLDKVDALVVTDEVDAGVLWVGEETAGEGGEVGKSEG